MNRSRNIIVLAVAGLMLALSFGSGALAASMITGKQIKNGTVTTKDVKNRTLKVKDFSSRTRSKLTGPQGPKGDSGLDGLDGLDGLPGLDGVSGFQVLPAATTNLPTLTTDSVQQSCPAGKVALSAVGGFTAPFTTSLLSQVSRVNETTFSVTGYNGLPGTQVLSIAVTCVTALP